MDTRPIGIFDSGIGGLTVVREVHRRLPGETIVYLGDTARVPYGTKTRQTVTRYADQVASRLLEQDPKLMVVACNTASAQALGALRDKYSEAEGPPALGQIQGRRARVLAVDRGLIPIVGVIGPGARAAARATRSGRVGVIGTEGTIRNGAYVRALASLRPDLHVVSVPCPLFVSLAEEGWVAGRVVELVAEEYLAPLRDEGVDTLILGCTHYPLLREVIQQTMGDGVMLIDGAPSTAEAVAEVLDRQGIEAPPERHGSVHYQATDNPERFRKVGSAFLRREIGEVEVVDL